MTDNELGPTLSTILIFYVIARLPVLASSCDNLVWAILLH